MRSRLGVRMLKSHELTGSQLVESNSAAGFDDAYAKELLASGDVDYIEPNYIVHTQATPNDTKFNDLWGMHNTGQTGGTANVDIDAPEAWNLTTGSTTVVVGVVDTGVDFNHPDLSANMWTNSAEIAGNGIDDDANGVVDDIYGMNAINPAASPLDDNGHGTHCAGTIGGSGNNSRGVAGVNWNVKIMALKFLDGSGSGSTSDAIEAIQYAVLMKQRGVNIRVLSNSWGGGGFSQALENAITAANQAGILFVAAAGNSASDNDSVNTYPANYEVANIVSVAAIDANGNLASFSNFGVTTVDLAAPGVGIVSTTPNNTYSSFSGTSMATPHVSGVAALVLAREPGLSLTELKNRLITTVKPLSGLNGLVVAPGTLDAYNALTNTQNPLPPNGSNIRYRKSAGSADLDPVFGERVLNVDDGYITKNLGFSFRYYGENYSRVSISANGRVIPLADGQSDPATSDYSNKVSPGMSILNDDLYPSNAGDGGVWFKTDGATATFTWVVVTYAQRSLGGGATEMRFQIKINAGGKIEFHYLDTNTGDANYDYGKSATVSLSPIAGGQKLTVSNNTANEAEIGNGKLLRFELGSKRTRNDFDGDEISDIAVWRPGSGMWYILLSSTNFDFNEHVAYQLGLPGDRPLTGDFDGDRLTDLAVWRPSNGTWYFRTSMSAYNVISSTQWGLNGDTPLVGDFDGDGVHDITVYRPNGGFFVLRSAGGFNRSAALEGSAQSLMTVSFPGLGNDPVVGDYTGDGLDDFVLIWQLIRFWTVKNSSSQMLSSQPWGNPGDTPLACDVDASGVADRVIVRPESSGLNWYIATDSGPVYSYNLGVYGDTPSCDKDFDGDGKPDLAVFRGGQWYVRGSETGGGRAYSFGLSGDIPL